MKRREVNSIFTVTDYRTGKEDEGIVVSGDGQSAISFLRKQYPRFTKFVLEGFEIEGNFIPVMYPIFSRL